MLVRIFNYLLFGLLILNHDYGRLLHADTDIPVIRIGVLNFGTVNWELEIIKRHGLDVKNNINIEVVPLASKNATHVALQGKAVDLIVTDWVWVSRQRYMQKDYTFVPYSTTAGSVMIKSNSKIKSLADLKGVKLGVAGGSVDKSWILLSAYVRKELNKDISSMVEPSFAAPPLLNALFIRGDFDAVLNFWHYAARLEALGNKTLISIQDILPALGVTRPLPMIGWVFSEQWARMNPELVSQFIETSSQAKQLLLNSDDAWNQIKPMMKVDSEDVYLSLISAYRQGIPGCFSQLDFDSMSTAYSILAKYGGKQLIGEADQLMPGTVWKNSSNKHCD